MTDISTITGVFNFANTNTLGELLRNFWFIDSHNCTDDIGCVTTFQSPAEAVEMTDEQKKFFLPYIYSYFDIGEEVREDPYLTEEEEIEIEEEQQEELKISKGFILNQDDYRIECFWIWDHDGCLIFRVFENDKLLAGVINNDCKKSYTWYNFQVATMI